MERNKFYWRREFPNRLLAFIDFCCADVTMQQTFPWMLHLDHPWSKIPSELNLTKHHIATSISPRFDNQHYSSVFQTHGSACQRIQLHHHILPSLLERYTDFRQAYLSPWAVFFAATWSLFRCLPADVDWVGWGWVVELKEWMRGLAWAWLVCPLSWLLPLPLPASCIEAASALANCSSSSYIDKNWSEVDNESSFMSFNCDKQFSSWNHVALILVKQHTHLVIGGALNEFRFVIVSSWLDWQRWLCLLSNDKRISIGYLSVCNCCRWQFRKLHKPDNH